MLKFRNLQTILPLVLIPCLFLCGTTWGQTIQTNTSQNPGGPAISRQGGMGATGSGEPPKSEATLEQLKEVSAQEALEKKLQEGSIERALENRKRQELREQEKRKIFFGYVPPNTVYIEKLQEPGEVSGVDEGAIERTLGTDIRKEAEIEPFGRAFFLKGEDISGSLDTVTTPSHYTLGPGDSLKIIIWSELGDETVYDVTVNPEGQVYIPILGVLGVSGQTVGQFQETVLGSLSEKFKHFKGQVTLSKVRTLQIFVAGEVRKPGAMVVSALATAFHALYRAGGPTDKGSMRRIRVLRGEQPVAEIDLYNYFLHGDKSQDVTLESGDTIFVPPIGERVKVKGELVRPGEFEILGEKTLADVLAMAGGIDASAYTGRVRVFRWQGGARRRIIDVGAADGSGSLAAMQIRNGDEIEVERATEEIGNRVRIEGAVARPGEYAVFEGTTISSVLAKAGGITSETYLDAGQVIRKLDQGREKMLVFNLGSALKHNPKDDLPLHPLDRIRVFFASEVRADTQSVSIAGAVRRPGEYILREGMRVRSLILRAQGLSADASREAEIASPQPDGRSSRIRRINLERVLKNSDDPDNLVLGPLDKVTVFARGGAILEPEIVVLTGEVKRPGPYALKRKGETLSELITRAGGLTDRAFPEGSVFLRLSAKVSPDSQIEAAEKVRGELFEQAALDLRADLMRAGAKFAEVSTAGGPEKPVFGAGEGEILGEAEKTGAEGAARKSVAVKKETSQFSGVEYSSRSLLQESVRIPIRLDEVLSGKSKGRDFDLPLEDGDQLTIPAVPSTVSVVGAVVNPTTLIYQHRAGPRVYIDQAGGFSDHSNHARTVVIRPNGEVTPLRRVREIRRGDIILVPPKAKLVRKDKLQQSGQIAQILGNLAVVYKVAIQNK